MMLSQIQYVEFENSNIFFEIEHKLNLKLIKEGCHICNIPYVGGGIVFVERPKKLIYTISDNDDCIDELKKCVEKQLCNKNYVVIYSKLNKPHPQYVYYNIIAIASNNINDFKKIMKIHKMKAFL